MKILLCHNYYQQRGGEDQSFEDEAAMLQRRGHDVIRYTVHNDALKSQPRAQTSLNAFWNREQRRRVRDLLRSEQPDLIHCTNTFPQLSPSIYYAAGECGTPVVQALRNYRLMCPAYSFLRDGKVCELCAKKKFAWPAIVNACYRGSRVGSAVVAGSFALHRALGTWRNKIAQYYTLTEFARRKFIEGGLPAERIAVKHNFIEPDVGPGGGSGNYVVFVGRLAEEKGVRSLLDAWPLVDGPLQLRIIGDGPLAPIVEQAAAGDSRIQWLKHLPLESLLAIVQEAKFLVCPSIWYETFGRVIAEAYSTGTPVIASDMGAMAELVQPGVTGWLFEPNKATSIAAAVEKMMADAAKLTNMRKAARAAYLAKFTSQRNYDRLIQLYQRALDWSAEPRAGISAPASG